MPHYGPQTHSSTPSERHQTPQADGGAPGLLALGADAPSQAAGASAGLVESVTSHTWNPLDPEFQRKRRLSRMRRAVLNGGDVITEGLQRRGFRYRAAMVTLTYRPGVEWSGHHVSSVLNHYRNWLRRRRHPLMYVWVAELQKRGAVHYHLVLWLPKGLTPPKPDAQGWWRHGMTRVEWARRPIGYLCKYTSKGEDVSTFPKGLRLHGRGGLSPPQRRVVSWWLLPRYVRDHFKSSGPTYTSGKGGSSARLSSFPEAFITRALGGGWINKATGEWLEGFSDGGIRLRTRRNDGGLHPRPQTVMEQLGVSAWSFRASHLCAS